MESHEFLTLNVSEYVATVTLARPPVNALTLGMFDDIAGVFHSIAERADDVRVAIITGDGGYFSAGRDVKAAGGEPPEQRMASYRRAKEAVVHCAVPVIGAIPGPALGAGFDLALSCDLIVASTHATFGWPEIDFGLMGGIAMTLRTLNPYQTRMLCFTGQRLTAAQLHEMGVVQTVVPPASLIDEALNLARVVAAKPPLAVRAAKLAVNEVEKLVDHEQAFRLIEMRAGLMLAATEDHKEAAAAFSQKRAPVFRGR
jgi:enoyl-CoA hydratase